jgi:formylglycine-generating enzyme required for sulfatase activity/energy-coupling factor transporter ATP-binding protein EcfA2
VTPHAGQNPFIGIRAFEPHESHLFHGRTEHIQQLLRLLAEHRLVAVVGTSGSGKSSLVKAGLLPALYRGYLRGATSRWRTAVMRPGPDPLSRLAEALCGADPEPVFTEPASALAPRLAEHSAALADVVRAAELDTSRENLLLVVDQFEEVFASGEQPTPEAAFFIGLLLRAAREFEVPLYIVLTMRSEFLGESARFPGLAQAISEAQYLVPQLTRAQLEEAIRGPLETVGTGIEDGLVQQLLHDAGNDPDQLPALQHALMRLNAQRKPDLTLALYAENREQLEVGRSLNTHAEEVFQSLDRRLARHSSPDAVKRIFRCLTNRDRGGRDIRRPARLSHLWEVTGLARGDVLAVCQTFGAKEHALLTLTDQQTGDPWIDITHETLIRQWDRLRQWVQAEAESAEWFRRVVQCERLHRKRQGGLWGELDIRSAERFEKDWSPAWARQYEGDSAFPGAMRFLTESREKVKADQEKARLAAETLEHARQREVEQAFRKRRMQMLTSFSAALLVAMAGLMFFTFKWREERQNVDRLRQAGAGSQLETIAELRNQIAGLSKSDAGKIEPNPRDGQRYVYIPAGEFMMGCSPGDQGCDSDESAPYTPTSQHKVRITKPFWMGQTEVTQAAYRKVTGEDPSHVKGADRPVENVSWDEAKGYCEKIQMRLPTEAEWEYAARAGNPEARYGSLDEIAWHSSNSGAGTKPVATRKPNAWGLYDTLGNVWEWTADRYDAGYYARSPVDNPQGPDQGGERVLRGGSWNLYPSSVRVSYRGGNEPAYRSVVNGFRCAGELR